MVPVKSETRKLIHENVKSPCKSITFSALFYVQYIVFFLHSSQNSSQENCSENCLWQRSKSDWNNIQEAVPESAKFWPYRQIQEAAGTARTI
jgi:hypothetical protein